MNPPGGNASTRLFWPACLIIALSLFFSFHVHVMVVDDGFIAHRYAANLIRGNGLVFNRGERVEGISDLAWTLLMTIPQLLGWRPELFALSLGIVCAVAALVVAYLTAVLRLGVPPLIALVVACGAACNADFWLVAANGIESGLYCLVITASLALLAMEQRPLLSGALLGFATTLRPESVALAPLVVCCAGVAGYFPAKRRDAASAAIKKIWPLLLPWAAIVLAVLLWRLAYYGQWLPNTVIAKSHPVHLSDFVGGVQYLFKFGREAAPWSILPLILFVTRRSFPVLVGLSWLLFQTVVILFNGGDWMFGYRMMSVFLPILAAFSAMTAAHWVRRLTSGGGIVCMALVALFGIGMQSQSHGWNFRRNLLSHHSFLDIVPGYDEPYYRNLAEALKPVLTRSDVIAPEVLGIVSYVLLDNPMHDWLGLVDGYIARHGNVYFPMFGKADPVYSTNVIAPTVFAFASGADTVGIFEKSTNGSFQARYKCWQVTGQPIILAVRRDREADLLTALRRSNLPLTPFHQIMRSSK